MQPAAAKGTTDEKDLYSEVKQHYSMASEDLRQRTIDFDRKDILFRSHINQETWPYSSVVFDPRIFTIITEKNARQFANKPRGRLLPRENSDAIKAEVNNEVLNYEWDSNEVVDEQTMLAKWQMMDLNCRKYGASFGLAKWHYLRRGSEVVFDGPNFKPWANRDVLHNPSYSTIKNWIQLRDYVTIKELEQVNDAARSKAVYKNLDILKESVKNEAKSGDTRASNYVVKNKQLKGLTDYLGQDIYNKTIEIITEYRPDRWITFSPNHGVIIRDIPNPYDHKQIPVVQLKYYPVDDDIYGLSEIEPLEKLQLAINAYINQNLDAINLATYQPLKVRKGGGAVEMHTLLFERGAIWQMENPSTDVLAHVQPSPQTDQFVTVYRMMVAALQEAAGETSASVSSQAPGTANKTATEINDLAASRSARDAINQLFLGEAMKKQMMLWLKMNQQFFFDSSNKQKIIRIVGKDAVQFFQEMGLNKMGTLSDQAHSLLSDPTMAGSLTPQDVSTPLYPATVNGKMTTKFSMEPGQQYGRLIVDKDDLTGDYDYIADTLSMTQNASQQEIQAKSDFLSRVSGVDPKTGQPTGLGLMLQKEGKQLKAAEFIVDYAKSLGFRNAEQYIENIPQQTQQAPQVAGAVQQPGQPQSQQGFTLQQPQIQPQGGVQSA